VILPDERQAICEAVRADLADGYDLIITTGGLGGTHDDVTMAAVAEACGLEMELREDALRLVEAAYDGWRADGVSSRTQHAFEQKQATLPVGATLIPPAGTAPGCALTRGDSVLVVLPGPPSEVHEMWSRVHLLPPVSSALARGGPRRQRVLRLYSVVESQFMDVVTRLPEEVVESIEMGVCARDGELEVSIAAASDDPITSVQTALWEQFGDRLYSSEGESIVETVVSQLRSRGQTVSVAESCTGGGLGAILTSVSGASEVFLGGVIAYGNSVKEAALGVSADVIVEHGAVSPQAAEAMAEGAVRVTGADWGVSITGIAGPKGGSTEKPVGLVYVGIVGPGAASVHELHLRGVRAQVRARAATRALHALRLAMAENEDGAPSSG
jgi:nicotinamide-nucleotide amidase